MCRFQVGGGLRTIEAVREAVDAGATWVVIGTAAYTDIDFLDQAVAELGDRVVVSIDARAGKLAGAGWTEQTDIPIEAVIERLGARGVQRFVYSSIDRDGMLRGPDLDGARRVAEAVRGIYAYSGGVSSLEDLRALVELRQVNLRAVIVGKALYEGRFTVADGAGRARRLMHYKRVIPCLDVDRGRVVKGVGFVDLRDAGDPVELACRYDAAGADELVFLDITATSDKRETVVDLARRTADDVFIPFTIGGGIRSVADAQAVLDAGADKVSINSAALARPELIDELAATFGAQCVVLAIDAKARGEAGWEAFVAGGRTPTGRDAVRWAREGVERGAGEILLDEHGPRRHERRLRPRADLSRVRRRRRSGDRVRWRGSARTPDRGARRRGADAVLCASIFHYGQHTVAEVKEALARDGVSVRPVD